MTKHDLQIKRLEAAVAAIKTAGGPDDLPFLAGDELTLVERLERRIAQAAARVVPARLRRAARAADERRESDWAYRLETQADRAATAFAYGLDGDEDLEVVPFHVDAAEHVARGWSVD